MRGTMFKFLRLALAALRLTILITKDDFPPIKYIRDEHLIYYPTWWEFSKCPNCVGFHAAWLVLLLNRFQLTRWLVDALAIAGLNVILHDSWKKNVL